MGALDGVKVVELAGIGPTPHCCMLLAEMGADVLRIDRLANVGQQRRVFPEKFDPLYPQPPQRRGGLEKRRKDWQRSNGSASKPIL